MRVCHSRRNPPWHTPGMFGKDKVKMKATIVADEGYKWASNGPKSAKQHETYIIEVHPDGEEPFRVEVKAWVSWPNMPEVGDTVPILHEPGTHKVELDLKGDPLFDSKVLQQKQKQADAARREELLNSPVPALPTAASTETVARGEQDATVCSGCGQPHAQGLVFCPRCGQRL